MTTARATGFIDAPLSTLSGVGTRRAADLAHAGLATLEDLLLRFPIRYEDRRETARIATLKPNSTAVVVGEIASAALRQTRRRGFTIFECKLRDDTGVLTIVWFNQRFLRDVFHVGQLVALYGKVELTGHGLQMQNPQYEILAEAEEAPEAAEEDRLRESIRAGSASLHYGRIVPVYERVGSLTTKLQRRLVFQTLEAMPADVFDPIPAGLLARLHLPGRVEALRAAHFPEVGDLANAAAGGTTSVVDLLNAFRSPAQVRLIFEEFFLFQLGVALRRQAIAKERKPFVSVVTDRIRDGARQVLPFSLTAGQKMALREIVRRRWPRLAHHGYWMMFIASRGVIGAPHQELASDVERLLASAGALSPIGAAGG